ncbi:YkgJ family cysteine cluster protein [Butyrivibrio sp. ob235]|uniref:YkgJ family cysteine cluster protein n=1 Tax=Butyrivibrio sp. ob235 TaxID=1761780 RepID=UPI000B8608E2
MFECTKCGECCRHLNNSSLYKELDRGDGVCIYLDGTLCSIYEKRPLLCRINDSYDAFFKEIYTYEEYIDLNQKACERLQKGGQ